jgi:3-dehydroquinate synthetase
MVEKSVSKASVIIGFGGGCLTNIAGLDADMIIRDIHYVEMATTLTGITDSC